MGDAQDTMRRSGERPPATLWFVATGRELLDGRVADRNLVDLAARLPEGVTVRGATVVGDERAEIADAVKRAADAARWVVVSGGLGPTDDDLTRHAVADWAGVELVEDAEARAKLEARYQRSARAVHAAALSQVSFPRGAAVLPNAIGTADGFKIEVGETTVWVLPGVPSEFRRLVDDHVVPALEPATSHAEILTFRPYGIAEGDLAEYVRTSGGDGAGAAIVGYRALSPGVEVRLRQGTAGSRGIDDLMEPLRPFALPAGVAHPAESVVEALAERGHTVATAESCTGGAIASAITDVPGASSVFEAGWVTYANDAKERELGVARSTLARHGAVSLATVAEMHGGAAARAGADLAIAVSGIAGPTGGTAEKPVGTVYIAVGRAGEPRLIHAIFDGATRARFKREVTALALLSTVRYQGGRADEIARLRGVRAVRLAPP